MEQPEVVDYSSERIVGIKAKATCFTSSDLGDGLVEDALVSFAGQLAELGWVGRVEGELNGFSVSLTLRFEPFPEGDNCEDDPVIDENVIVEINHVALINSRKDIQTVDYDYLEDPGEDTERTGGTGGWDELNR